MGGKLLLVLCFGFAMGWFSAKFTGRNSEHLSFSQKQGLLGSKSDSPYRGSDSASGPKSHARQRGEGFEKERSDQSSETKFQGTHASSSALTQRLPRALGGTDGYSAFLREVWNSSSVEKKTTLFNLLPSDIKLWSAIREERERAFLAENTQFASNPDDNEPLKSWDQGLAESALGRYRAELSFELTEVRQHRQGTLKLDLLNFSEQAKNKITTSFSDGGSWNSNFRIRNLGTDSAAQALNVVWYNFESSQTPFASHLAFKLPLRMEQRQTAVLDLYGLTEGFQWSRIGKVRLEKLGER
ncbi:MAG: hypothetical protein AB1540_17255 [Bdellovibrionota bacterium]